MISPPVKKVKYCHDTWKFNNKCHYNKKQCCLMHVKSECVVSSSCKFQTYII